MKLRLLLVSTLLALASGCATTATTPTAEAEHNHAAMPVSGQPKYNTTMNPRQTEHPNTLGFNDLHIQAIRHLKPDVFSAEDPKLQAI
jgi:hypothetical protein